MRPVPFADVHVVEEDSPAEHAGLLPGDIIVRLGTCTTFAEVAAELQRMRGVAVRVAVQRSGEPFEVELVPRRWNPELPGSLAGMELVPHGAPVTFARVTDMDPAGLAASAGLLPGDELLSIGEATATADAHLEIRRHAGLKIEVSVLRGDAEIITTEISVPRTAVRADYRRVHQLADDAHYNAFLHSEIAAPGTSATEKEQEERERKEKQQQEQREKQQQQVTNGADANVADDDEGIVSRGGYSTSTHAPAATAGDDHDSTGRNDQSEFSFAGDSHPADNGSDPLPQYPVLQEDNALWDVFGLRVDAEKDPFMLSPFCHVTSVRPRLPANAAGLLVGDHVMAFDGARTIRDIERRLARAAATGGTLDVSVYRDGAPVDVTVEIQAQEPPQGSPAKAMQRTHKALQEKEKKRKEQKQQTLRSAAARNGTVDEYDDDEDDEEDDSSSEYDSGSSGSSHAVPTWKSLAVATPASSTGPRSNVGTPAISAGRMARASVATPSSLVKKKRTPGAAVTRTKSQTPSGGKGNSPNPKSPSSTPGSPNVAANHARTVTMRRWRAHIGTGILLSRVLGAEFAYYANQGTPFARVGKVHEGSPAEAAELQEGDLVMLFGDADTMSEMAQEMLRELGRGVDVLLLRGGITQVHTFVPDIWNVARPQDYHGADFVSLAKPAPLLPSRPVSRAAASTMPNSRPTSSPMSTRPASRVSGRVGTPPGGPIQPPAIEVVRAATPPRMLVRADSVGEHIRQTQDSSSKDKEAASSMVANLTKALASSGGSMHSDDDHDDDDVVMVRKPHISPLHLPGHPTHPQHQQLHQQQQQQQNGGGGLHVSGGGAAPGNHSHRMSRPTTSRTQRNHAIANVIPELMTNQHAHVQGILVDDPEQRALAYNGLTMTLEESDNVELVTETAEALGPHVRRIAREPNPSLVTQALSLVQAYVNAAPYSVLGFVGPGLCVALRDQHLMSPRPEIRQRTIDCMMLLIETSSPDTPPPILAPLMAGISDPDMAPEVATQCMKIIRTAVVNFGVEALGTQNMIDLIPLAMNHLCVEVRREVVKLQFDIYLFLGQRLFAGLKKVLTKAQFTQVTGQIAAVPNAKLPQIRTRRGHGLPLAQFAFEIDSDRDSAGSETESSSDEEYGASNMNGEQGKEAKENGNGNGNNEDAKDSFFLTSVDDGNDIDDVGKGDAAMSPGGALDLVEGEQQRAVKKNKKTKKKEQHKQRKHQQHDDHQHASPNGDVDLATARRRSMKGRQKDDVVAQLPRTWYLEINSLLTPLRQSTARCIRFVLSKCERCRIHNAHVLVRRMRPVLEKHKDIDTCVLLLQSIGLLAQKVGPAFEPLVHDLWPVFLNIFQVRNTLLDSALTVALDDVFGNAVDFLDMVPKVLKMVAAKSSPAIKQNGCYLIARNVIYLAMFHSLNVLNSLLMAVTQILRTSMHEGNRAAAMHTMAVLYRAFGEQQLQKYFAMLPPLVCVKIKQTAETARRLDLPRVVRPTPQPHTGLVHTIQGDEAVDKPTILQSVVL